MKTYDVVAHNSFISNIYATITQNIHLKFLFLYMCVHKLIFLPYSWLNAVIVICEWFSGREPRIIMKVIRVRVKNYVPNLLLVDRIRGLARCFKVSYFY